MNAPSPTPSEWSACPPGALTGFARRERRRGQRRLAGELAGLAALLLIAGGVIYGTTRRQPVGEPTYGGIACSEVRREAPAFLAGKASPELAGRIRLHLAECQHCRDMLGQMAPAGRAAGAAQAFFSDAAVAASPAGGCSCPHCRRGEWLATK